MQLRHTLLGLMAALVTGAPATAQTLFADTVIEYRKSGRGPLPEPYGGRGAHGKYPYQLRDLSYAFDGDPGSAVSLPRGASLAVGFSGGFIFDGPGDDLFISELGASKELADVFVSSNFGRSWTFLGRADGGRVTRFDFRRVGFRGKVNAVKIVGLDMKGTYPGFDVAYVEGLKGSIRRQPQRVPERLGGRTGGGGASGTPVQRAPKAGSSAADLAHQRKMEDSRARARREMELQMNAEGAAGQRAARQNAARKREQQAQREAERRSRQRAAEQRARDEAARQGSGGGGALSDLLDGGQ